jgi:F-type H+-transporting ATPase subunit b
MEKLINDFSFGLFFWQTLLFLVLILLLAKFAWKPILNAVNEREKSIEDALNQAKKAREEMALLKAENEKILIEAKMERDAILKEAREAKESIIAKAKETAQVEADRLVENAKSAIQNEKMAAMTDLKNQVAQLSIEVAEKVLTKELSNKSAQEELAKEIINEAKFN